MLGAKSDSLASFEHINMEDVQLHDEGEKQAADTSEQNPSTSAPAAEASPASEQHTQAAKTAKKAAVAGGPGKAEAGPAGPAAGAPAATGPAAADEAAASAGAAAAPAAASAPPPATQAFSSVLSFFSGQAPSGAAAAATPVGEGWQEERGDYDAVADFENEAIDAADKVAREVEEVRGGPGRYVWGMPG